MTTTITMEMNLKDGLVSKGKHAQSGTQSCTQFKDSRFMTAVEKRRVMANWVTFLGSGFDPSRFTKSLYAHLINHASFIAHFSAQGFVETYFIDPSDTQRFLDQFDRSKGCLSVEYGDAGWIDAEDYRDINNAMVDAATGQLPELRRALREREVAKARLELGQAEGRLKQLLGAKGRGIDMPFRTTRVKAPLFMTHRGTKVYGVFKNDDADVGDLRMYAYTFDPFEGSDDQTDGVVTFDVRNLSTFDKAAPDDKNFKKAIRKALDKGEIGPTKMAVCSLCGKLCDAMKAHLHQGKWIGDECCWDERLKASE